jgi:ubiquinone/menaquinone biosynthesis C-methylase UbiE
VEFVPSEDIAVDSMLSIARVGPSDVVYDLGSGDGRIIIAAAKRFGARGVGIDIDPRLVAQSRRSADSAGVAKLVDFREGDLFEADLREATVVVLYLLPELNLRLRPKLLAEMAPGTRVVSHEFDMGDWRPDTTVMAGWSKVHLWTIGRPQNARVTAPPQ